MTRQTISVVSLLCAFVFFSASVSAFFFTPDRVHLLDTKAIGSSGCSAYLFRGPVPLDKDLTFVHSDLVKAMADGASAVNVDFPQKNLKIIDFSLLDPTSATELTWIESERAFFSNGTMGSLFETPMHGSSVNPYFLPSKAQNELGIDYKDWSKDHLPALIDALNYLVTGDSSSLLNHASSYETFSIFGYSAEALAASRALASDGTCSDIAIYFHCHYGQDRTGEVAGSYLLTYGGFLQSYATPVPSPNTFTRGIPATLQQLVKMNEQVAGGHIVKNNQRALSWTCFSLVALGDVAHKNLDCSLNYEIDPPLNGPAPAPPTPANNKNSNSNASANNNNNSNDSSASALGVSSSVALFVLFVLFSVVF